MMKMNDKQTNKLTKKHTQWKMTVRFEAQPVFTFDDFLKKNGQQQQQLATTAKNSSSSNHLINRNKQRPRKEINNKTYSH